MQAAQQPEIMMDYPCNPYAPNSMADLRDGNFILVFGVLVSIGTGLLFFLRAQNPSLAICAGSILRFNASRKKPAQK